MELGQLSTRPTVEPKGRECFQGKQAIYELRPYEDTVYGYLLKATDLLLSESDGHIPLAR